jgi:hypothetical protein
MPVENAPLETAPNGDLAQMRCVALALGHMTGDEGLVTQTTAEVESDPRGPVFALTELVEALSVALAEAWAATGQVEDVSNLLFEQLVAAKRGASE